MRGFSWGRLALMPSSGQGNPPSIPLDDALPAGGLQIAAELRGFVLGAERADHGAVIDALVAQIRPLDQRRAGTEHGREFTLKRLIGGLRVGLVLLRRHLHDIAATAASRGG